MKEVIRMKSVFLYGTAVLALSVAPLLAQQPSGGSSTREQPGARTDTATPQTGAGSQPRPSSPATDTAGGSSTRTPQQNMSKAANPDHSFVMDAAMGGMAEVELGQLATEKAQSEQVKQFAQRMVTDHGKANDELKSLAQSKNISLPTDSGAKHKATKDRLAKLSGSAFDRAYMQEMVADHRKDVSEFQREAKGGKDPDVKAWAAKTLPTLQEHMQMAQSASRNAVGTSGTKPDTEKAPTTTPRTPGGATPRDDSPTTPPSTPRDSTPAPR
jgi:putative membrane protein